MQPWHWFRLMSDALTSNLFWTSRLCRVMLLLRLRATSLSSGGDSYDIDPNAMPLLSWEERRGTAHLHYEMRRTTDPIPLFLL